MRTKCLVAFSALLAVVLAGGVFAYATNKANNNCCFPGSPCCVACCDDCCEECCDGCCDDCCYPGCCPQCPPCCEVSCCTKGTSAPADSPEPTGSGSCCAKSKKASCCGD